MAPASISTSHSSALRLPSPAQIALALSIIKSKPQSLSVEEYILGLRENLLPGRRPRSNDRHLDSAEFWKLAYEKGEAEQTRLRNRIYELEQPNLSVTNVRDSNVTLDETRRAKRKLDETEGIKANSRSKRVATSHIAPYDDDLEAELLRAGKSREGNLTLLRGFDGLRRALAKDSSKPSQLLVALRALCKSAISALQDPPCTAPGHAAPQLFRIQVLEDRLYCNICAAFGRIYPSILTVLDHLSTSNVDESHLRPAISYVSSVLKSLLHDLSSFVTEVAHLRSPKSRSKSRSKTKGPDDADYIEMCRCIIRVIVCTTTTLDLKKRAHCQLFEALMCIFLEHLGSTLSLVVFASGSDLGSKSQKIQLGVLPPQGLQDMANVDYDTALAAAEVEAPFLVLVVKKTLKHLDDARNSSSTLPVPQEAFLRTVGEKLQNTLLRGIFGDEDENFRNALQRPQTPELDDMDSNDDPSKTKQSPSEWFISEVWEHLGWGTVAGHILPSSPNLE